MSRFLKILAATLLALSLSAVAQADTFKLRNGYIWGMFQGPAESLARKEGLTETETGFETRIAEGHRVIAYENVPVGDAEALMVLRFDPNAMLQAIYYQFPGTGPEDQVRRRAQHQSLQKALEDVYGPASDAIMDMVRWELSDTIISLSGWTSPDNKDLTCLTILYLPRESFKDTSGF